MLRFAFSAILLSWLMSPQALAQWVKFDTSACKQQAHGMFYLALGQNVLKIPQITLGGFMRLDPQHRLVPPDPLQPEGCPGNPLQVQLYHFDIALVENSRSKSRIDFQLPITLYRTVRYDWPDTNIPEWVAEDAILKWANKACEVGVSEDKGKEFRSCLASPLGRKTPEEDWGGVYVAKPDVYRTPLGYAFVIDCEPGQLTAGWSRCDVTYALRPELGLSYHIRPFAKFAKIRFENAITLDQQIRARLNSMLIAPYSWGERHQPKTSSPPGARE